MTARGKGIVFYTERRCGLTKRRSAAGTEGRMRVNDIRCGIWGMDMNFKSVSIVTPTFNSMRTLKLYMEAILSQTYPHALIEIIFADGGSDDGTIEAIQNYKEKQDIKISIYENPLKTAEAGKAVGVRRAVNEIICLLDSDNIIPDEKWLERMTAPFEEKDIVASEPIAYTYRREDQVINRYCALIGMNDPLCIFTGRWNGKKRIVGIICP